MGFKIIPKSYLVVVVVEDEDEEGEEKVVFNSSIIDCLSKQNTIAIILVEKFFNISSGNL